MAKGIYIGGSVPKYITTTETVNITAGNISAYFTVSNSNYYFVGSGSTFTTNNGGVASSTAKTTLTAKQDMSNITFNYSYSSEAGWDKFTLTVAGTVVENGVSGATTTKSYNGTLSAGDIIIFQYAKDGSANANNDKCTFSDMVIQIQTLEQDGTIDNVARKVTQPYIGVSNVARNVTSGYVGVNGVARECFTSGIRWHKYNCSYTAGYYSKETLNTSYTATYHINSTSGYHGATTSYTFSSTSGFLDGDDKEIKFTIPFTVSEISSFFAGTYRVYTTYVDQYVSVASSEVISDTEVHVTWNMKHVASATYYPPSYSKGLVSYGTITAKEGQLPEEGTLVKGSVAEGYCVLQVGSDYYYYEKEI